MHTTQAWVRRTYGRAAPRKRRPRVIRKRDGDEWVMANWQWQHDNQTVFGYPLHQFFTKR